nr:MAG TPA: hypothetical protein [Caudoviricetes sp.]DAH55871.1 MAG TPA: hypothetical protein [Caudoviricetes sp.]DAZ29521.1 MAG TPA: hypothetical protein [Caudoviricetes sp.]
MTRTSKFSLLYPFLRCNVSVIIVCFMYKLFTFHR